MTITPPALRSKTPNSVAHGGRLSSKVLAAIVRRPSGSQIGGGAVAGAVEQVHCPTDTDRLR